ncbi:MAG: DNA-binding protein [Lautropia sp.]|nr:DNA-binding protein [Lautropia sp.]MCL4700553.1 OB-fold domain-containing protein [Burkholderiaceae bacterium]MCZ2414845.1 OB-fold domain-containing protein [Burkholderiales bacterium]MDL1905972.1 DNA-binding protein [Betaproteobacteria bacterium PRO1]MEB2335836.1 OB-fold domain-containing protein [Burkholderiales bacterium]
MSRTPTQVIAETQPLAAAYCDSCGHLFLPFGPLCPRCWSDRIGTRALSGLGEVATYTVYRQQYHPDFPPPYVIAVIALREGPRMVSNIVDCAPEDVRVGMAVRVDHRLRDGRLLPLFVPASSGAGSAASHPGGKT